MQIKIGGKKIPRECNLKYSKEGTRKIVNGKYNIVLYVNTRNPKHG